MKKMYQFISVLSLACVLAACGSDDKPLDSDGDGVPDKSDVFPQDRSESKDTDLDGVGDNADAFPEDPDETLDTDNDGVGNNEDPNDDNDGELDGNDAFPLDPTETLDIDQDGIGDNKDLDLISTEKNSIRLSRMIETGRATRFLGPLPDVASPDMQQFKTIGDINGDGFDDFAVSYKDYLKGEYKAGIVYVFFGAQDLQWPSEIDLNAIPASVAHIRFEFQREITSDWWFGSEVAALGDVNGDNIDDFSITSLRANNGDIASAGMVHIVFGHTDWITDAGEDNTISHQSLMDNYSLNLMGNVLIGYLGSSVVNVGDINGDTFNDIFITEPRYDTAETFNRGRIHIMLGGKALQKPSSAQTAYLSIDDIPESQRMRITSNIDYTSFAYQIIPLGNFDNDPDNLQDFLIRSKAGKKKWHVMLGSKDWAANMDFEDMIPTHGFAITFDVDVEMAVGNIIKVDGEANPLTKDILMSYGRSMYIFKGGVGSWPAELNQDNLTDFFTVKVSSNPDTSMGAEMIIYPDTNNDGIDDPFIYTITTSDGDSLQRFITERDWSAPFTEETFDDSIQRFVNDVTVEAAISGLSIIGDHDGDGIMELVIDRPLTGSLVGGYEGGDFIVIKGFSEVYP